MKPGTTVDAYLINGMRGRVPNELVTITDWARILVAEAASSPATKQAATHALQSFTIDEHEAWTSAAGRLMLHIRASEVSQSRPFASEDMFFWRFMTDDLLLNSMDLISQVVLESSTDVNSVEGYMMRATRVVKETCSNLPIEYHNPLSQAMENRGRCFQKVHTEYVEDLANRRQAYYSKYEYNRETHNAGARKSSSVMALSRKRSAFGHQIPVSRRRGAPFTRSHLLGALTGHDVVPEHIDALTGIADWLDEESDVQEVTHLPSSPSQVAAFDNRAASVPGATGTPYKSNFVPRRIYESPPGKPQEARAESADPRLRQRAVRAQPENELDAGQISEELPAAGADPNLIFETLKSMKVCFYHAKGTRCPHNQGVHRRCKFSHDNSVVPYGTYRPPDVMFAMNPTTLAHMDMHKAYGSEAETVASVDTNGSSSTRPDSS